jgi:bile acid:Na+ symporter, BASS family
VSGLFTLLKALTWCATFAVMFGGAARVGVGSLRRVRMYPALFARTLLAVWILVPVFTLVVVELLAVRGMSATMLLLMAVCPGLPLLVASTRTVRGSMATAMLALLLTAATEPLLIPQWTRILSAFHPSVDVRVQPHHVIAVLAPTVFLPIVLGFALRALWPRAVAALARASDVIYLVSLPIKVVVALEQGAPLLLHIPWQSYVAAMIISVGDALIGYWVGRPDVRDQKALALATALGNPALAIAVIEVGYPDETATTLVAAYLIVRAIAITPFEWWLKRLVDRRATV